MQELQTILLITILIGFYLRQVLSECEIKIMANEDILIAKNMDNILIESDSEKKFNILDDQIKQLLQIPIQQNEKIIATQFIESHYDKFSAEKWLCQLILIIHEYYISCINDIYIDEDGEINLKNEKQIRLHIEISKDDQCHQFYSKENSEFIIFCNTYQNLNIYSVNLFNQTKLELSYQYNLLEQHNCLSQQFHNIDFGYQIISFIKCYKWQILKYQDNSIQILANSLKYPQIKNPNQIYICGRQLILIEDDTIYKFSLTQQLDLIDSQTYLEQFIYNIIFTKSCNIKYYMIILKLNNRKLLYIKSKESKEFIDQNTVQIYSAFDYLFFQLYDKVQITWFEDQQFEINCFPQSIVFVDKYYLFYIIDHKSKFISIYKINKLVNYVQPTKGYVYEISIFYSRIYVQQCYEIVHKNIKTKPNIITYDYKNECQLKEDIIIKKDNYNFPIYQEFENEGQQQNTIKYLIQNVYLTDYCPDIEQYIEENELQYYQSKNLDNYAILNSNDTLTVLYCTTQNIIQHDVRDYQVIKFQDGILMITNKEQPIQVIYYSIGLNQHHEIQINSQIKAILQFKQYVIILTENQDEILFIDIVNSRQKEISSKLKYILNLFVKDQIQIKKQRFYYAQFLLFQIYQINKLLVLEYTNKVNIYNINDITIIYTGESMQLSNTYIMNKRYCVIAIHNKLNMLKQYILDDSLKLFENYNIEDYNLIRPVQFQNSKEYLVIALNQLDKNYLFIFQIQQPLKLIKIIKINKLNFYLENDLLYYYNKDLQIQIFNIKYFQIQYVNLAEKQQQIVLHEITPLQFKHQTEENPPNQVFLELIVNNYCRNLNSQKNEQTIQVEETEMIRIDNIDMFYGPIDQIILKKNPKLELVGPFLQQKEIEECKLQNQVCYTKMELEQQFLNDEQQKIFYSLRYYNKQKILPLYSRINQKQNEIINAYVFRNTLLLYFDEIKRKMFVNVVQFNKTQLNQQYDPMLLTQFQKDDLNQAQFYQSNNLFLIKTSLLQKILKITQNNIYEIEINFDLSNILFIENSDNQYVEMKVVYKLDECYFLFNIFKLINTNLLIKDSYKIYYDKIEITLSQHIYIDIYQLEEYFKNQLLESTLIENQIEIKVLQISLSFSVISKIKINLETQDIMYDVQKVFRHPKSQELLNLVYYDNNILILTNSLIKKSFLYDQRQIKPFYDYIQKIDDDLLKLYPLNTTHYLFYFYELNRFVIGEIGFEIWRLEELNDMETCIIIGSNEVSQSQFTLIIKRLSYLSQEAKIMTTSVILLGSFYLLRRNKLKQQQELQNQSSINSEIIQIDTD